jgi:hypothetical protein
LILRAQIVGVYEIDLGHYNDDGLIGKKRFEALK